MTSMPSFWWPVKDGNYGVVPAAPKTSAKPDALSYCFKVSWVYEKANTDWAKSDGSRKAHVYDAI